MPRRPPLPAALLLPLLAGCAAEDAGPTGVLLVSIDSLRADHLSCYGYRSATNPSEPTTPAIDRLLAADGARFENAVSTTSWTLPAHAALLTGVPHEALGVRELPDRLPTGAPLLAEVLAHDGWRTFGVWSGPNLHPYFGFDRGFETYADRSSVAHPDAARVLALEAEGGRDTLRGLQDASHTGVTGPGVADAATAFLDGLGADERFFCFVHLWDVHYDYEAPAEYDRFHPQPYDGPIDGRDFKSLNHGGPHTVADVQRLVSLYDAEVRFTDAVVERILTRLAELGRLDDTLVVLTSDHGEEFLEHGLFGHKNGLYEEVVRVPLVVRWPAGVRGGTTPDALVSLVDVAPTIADFAGVELPGAWGRSLRPLLGGGAAPEARLAPLEVTNEAGGLELRGAHGLDHKVYRNPPAAQEWWVDLERDPDEREPKRALRDGRPTDPRVGAAHALWRELDALGAGRTGGDGALPDALREALENAGYLEERDAEGPDEAGGERP